MLDDDLLSHAILHLVEVLRHPAGKVACCRHIVPWQVLANHIRNHKKNTSNQYMSLWRGEKRDKYHTRSRNIIMSKDGSYDHGSIFRLIFGEVSSMASLLIWFQTCLRTASKNLVLILNTCFFMLIISLSLYPHVINAKQWDLILFGLLVGYFFGQSVFWLLLLLWTCLRKL